MRQQMWTASDPWHSIGGWIMFLRVLFIIAIDIAVIVSHIDYM